jgi:DNA-binding NtrC family response regulator
VSSVLIVDDERPVRELLQRWLDAQGYDTRQAPDAETALDVMTASPSDVVLCDVEMPGKGGLWLIGRLRERCPDSAVVLATGVDSVPPSIGLRDGVTGYIVKPFNRERVLTEVKNALQWHTAAREGRIPKAGGQDVVADWLESAVEEDLKAD